MVKPSGIKPSDIKPQVSTEGQTIQQKEAEKAKSQQNKAISSSDRARLASQAGFQRMRRAKGKKGLDIGDSSDAPIPLPGDELDPDAWSQEKLDSAQGSLALAGSQFGDIAETEGADLAESVVGSSFMPVEEDLDEMQRLADLEPQEPAPMLEEVSTDVGRLFGIELGEKSPPGHKVLAAGLVVAGEPDSVQVEEGKLREKELAGGIEKVTKRGNQAVGEAQKMSKGINREVNRQRTLIVKR